MVVLVPAMKDEGTTPPRLVPATPLAIPLPDLKLKPSLEAVATPLPKMSTEKLQPKKWNTKNLGLRLGADAISASCAAGMVAPIIAIIDQYVPPSLLLSPSPPPSPLSHWHLTNRYPTGQ